MNATTKEKILQIASELFARNGFGGTSVREIALNAEVNLAAINYHFKNKENLYWKVFDYNYDWMKKGIEKIGEKNLLTGDLTVEVFNFFLKSDSMILNTFKIFLTGNVSKPEEELHMDEEERFGPPGQSIFLETIERDIGEEMPEAAKRWVMKMIFSQLVHFGVILNTTLMKEKCKSEDDLSPEFIAKSLRMSVEAHLQYAKSNQDIFLSIS